MVRFHALTLGFILLVSSACTMAITPLTRPIQPGAVAAPSASTVTEVHPVSIPLSGPVADPDSQISGLAWYADHLILLPQYPDFASLEEDGAVFAISKQTILDVLEGAHTSPVEPRPIPLIAPGLRAIPGYDGLEAIAFDGDTLYVSIEVGGPDYMGALVMKGQIVPDLSALTLDTTRWARIESPTGFRNLSEEALLWTPAGPMTLYEAPGNQVNPAPVAHIVNPSLGLVSTTPFPNIEYRVTDATALDSEDRFWVINYYYPGDLHLRPEHDPIAMRTGQGATHASFTHVERLLELALSDEGVRLTGRAPVQLGLSFEPRNWEGIVRLDDQGFLIATDTFPRTILAFVPAAN